MTLKKICQTNGSDYDLIAAHIALRSELSKVERREWHRRQRLAVVVELAELAGLAALFGLLCVAVRHALEVMA